MFDDIEFTGWGVFWTVIGVATVVGHVAYAIEGKEACIARSNKHFEDAFGYGRHYTYTNNNNNSNMNEEYTSSY